MDKSSTSPVVPLLNVPGYEGRKNDVVFCGSEAQQHVVFFPGDVQVSRTNFVTESMKEVAKLRPKSVNTTIDISFRFLFYALTLRCISRYCELMSVLSSSLKVCFVKDFRALHFRLPIFCHYQYSPRNFLLN